LANEVKIITRLSNFKHAAPNVESTNTKITKREQHLQTQMEIQNTEPRQQKEALASKSIPTPPNRLMKRHKSR